MHRDIIKQLTLTFFYNKVKHGKMLQHKISCKVLKVFALECFY